MASELEKLAAAVRELAAESSDARRLLGVHGRAARHLASRARSAGRPGAPVAFAIDTAGGDVASALVHLDEFGRSARSFAARLDGGGAGGGGFSGNAVSGPEGGLVRNGEGRSATSALSTFWSAYPGEYRVPDSTDWDGVPSELEPHSDPWAFAQWVNDGGEGVDGRGVNCADCARAVEANWRGRPQVAAARTPGSGGESFGRIESSLGGPLESSSLDGIGSRLSAAGHGASAYVAVTWHGGSGHAFNAVNYRGTVLFVDAQPEGGAVGPWPPSTSSPGYGYSAADIDTVSARFFDP